MGVLVEVVIGLAFAFLLVSLICTIVNELVATFFKQRAKQLHKGLEAILDDGNLRREFFQSRLVNMAGRASGASGPSYMASETFVMALLAAIDPKDSSATSRTASDIKAAVDKLPPSDLKSTLSELVRNTGDNVEAIQKAVGDWFDQMMDRLSGVYKRQMQVLSLVVAAVLCIGLNVDSIEIGKTLWVDDTLRQSIASRASTIAAETNNPDELADLVEIAKDLRRLPIGWDYTAPGWSGDWYRSAEGWGLKVIGLLFSVLAVSLGAPFWFDLLNKFVALRGSGKKPPPAKTPKGKNADTEAPADSARG